MSISVRNITKKFGEFIALDHVNLDVDSGELVALLGPSGSGKTSLLRIIAGLENPDQGTILIHGEDAAKWTLKDRRVGFVFQHYALFRNMTVFENVAFGLRVKPRPIRPSRQEIAKKVNELLELVQMDWMADRYPHQLSGGQRQRIALARALAIEPSIMLLDEPFGALDARVRKELRRWLRRLHQQINVTSVFVTHDQEEALEVADRVVIMNEGRIEQVGTPEDIYERPGNLFVYKFLGDINFFRGRLNKELIEPLVNNTEFEAASASEITPVTYFARPHELDIVLEKDEKNSVQAIVNYIRAIGPIVRIELIRCDDHDVIEVELTQERYKQLGIRVEDKVFIRFKSVKLFNEVNRE